MKRIVIIVGARPNFIKINRLIKLLKKKRRFRSYLVHTGQHYDFKMSQIFFKELGIPKPDVHLAIEPHSPIKQMGQMMERLEEIIPKLKPDLAMVVGDVNSTLAGALTCSRLGIRLAH